jgi:hypothetical protein
MLIISTTWTKGRSLLIPTRTSYICPRNTSNKKKLGVLTELTVECDELLEVAIGEEPQVRQTQQILFLQTKARLLVLNDSEDG